MPVESVLKGLTMTSLAVATEFVGAQTRASSLAFGCSVLSIEAAALQKLAEELDDHFLDAIDLILARPGRLVITGMGKSGHIARKMAATFASTGTPAFFVHPAEAAHGDLGMLVAGDLLIMLSNSGGTIELRPLVERANLLGLPIIGITSKAQSELARAATVTLILPSAEEACPANLAPTTSTTMMLGLGDALAMVVMRARGISRDGFELLHPGGAIGARLMRVGNIMHGGSEMPLVTAHDSMRDVVFTMTACSFGIAAVVGDQGELIGVITDGDLRRNVDRLMDSTAADVMTQSPATIAPTASLDVALELMKDRKITCIMVTDEDCRPAGLLHLHDLFSLGLA